MRLRTYLYFSGRVILPFIATMAMATAICLLAPHLQAADGWRQFRGPNGQGVVKWQSSPANLEGKPQLLWQTSVPAGNSSPTVLLDGSIVLTAQESGQLKTLCFDLSNGSARWSRHVTPERTEKAHAMTTLAASTPVTDGTRVFAFFGSFGLLAYGGNGEELWRKPLPAVTNRNGCASSPILCDRGIALAVDCEEGNSYVILVDPKDGRTLWKKPRPLIGSGWSTPVIWANSQGDQLIVLGSPRLEAFDLRTGDLKWWLGGFPGETEVVPTIYEKLLIVSAQGFGSVKENGYAPAWEDLVRLDTNKNGRIEKSELTPAIGWRSNKEIPDGTMGNFFPLSDEFEGLDGNHDGGISQAEWDAVLESVTKMYPYNRMVGLRDGTELDASSRVVWESKEAVPHIASPIVHNNRLYSVHDGILACREAATGRMIYRERLGAPGQYLASPVIAAVENQAVILVASRKGVLTIVKCGDAFKVTAQLDLKANIYASPALDGGRGRIYVRTQNALCCLSLSSPRP